jgi:hypothetical protein
VLCVSQDFVPALCCLNCVRAVLITRQHVCLADSQHETSKQCSTHNGVGLAKGHWQCGMLMRNCIKAVAERRQQLPEPGHGFKTMYTQTLNSKPYKLHYALQKLSQVDHVSSTLAAEGIQLRPRTPSCMLVSQSFCMQPHTAHSWLGQIGLMTTSVGPAIRTVQASRTPPMACPEHTPRSPADATLHGPRCCGLQHQYTGREL